MKKILLIFLLFIFIDVVYASDVYISKKDIDTGDYVLDCDFLLIDENGNVVDSWIQSSSAHVSSLANGSYELISRPFIMGAFNDEMSTYYKLDVNDDILQFTIYNSKIETPKNLGSNNYFVISFLLILFGLVVVFCCKYSYI